MIANCRTTIDLFAGFVDDALPVEELESLRAHMAKCPRCVEFLESYRATGRIVRDATRVAMPADIEARLLALLAARRT